MVFPVNSAYVLKKINISNPKIPESSYLPTLKKTTVTGFQYTGKFLHLVAVDDDVSYI